MSLATRLRLNTQYTADNGLAKHMLGGFFLGMMCAVGLCGTIYSYFVTRGRSKLMPFSVWTFFFALSNTLEYIWHAYFHPETLSFDAFILYTHSRQFHYAMSGAIIEYVFESYMFPWMKIWNGVTTVGLFVVVLGQCVRTTAMWTAGWNFSHIIQRNKDARHELVTTGIYSFSRHPSYAGWFWWSIGTQLLLCNPFCVFAYGFGAWTFFYERIAYEEQYLHQFFGEEYNQYKQRTPVGIPFIE